jgi:hypothetical protein
MIEEEHKDDLELKDIGQFYGTQNYYKGWLGVNYTDGVNYVSNNGYSWLVTDAISVIKTDKKILDYLKEDTFLSVKLKVDVEKGTAIMTIEDGNKNILYTQNYDYTDAKRDLVLYFVDNVLMLAGEY